MVTTSRWGLEYPGKDDRPEGWLQLQALAEDVDAVLGSALRVADAAARSALGTELGTGGPRLLVVQDDTSQPYLWLGTVWLAVGAAGGGGGGGGAGSRGRYLASGAAQSIPNADDTVVAFATDALSTPDIVKTTLGDGHGFTFQRAGVLRGTATLRYATTTANGVRHAHVVLGDNATYLGSGGGGQPGQPVPISMSIGPVDVAEDDVLSVRCFQGTGAPRNLEPNGGQWCHLELELS